MGIEEVAKSSCPCLVENNEKDKESEKEKIIVQALRGDDDGFRYTEFYTIDMRKRQVLECPYALLSDYCYNTIVSLGSVVYVVGGMKPEYIKVKTKPPHSRCTKKGIYHKCISYLDLANDNDNDNGNGDGWKAGPCLSEGPSHCPSVVAFGGKIYLFHLGSKTEKAEVFDPILNKWETLLPPPSVGFFSIEFPNSAVADSQNNRILVHFTDIQSVFAYYPADNQWELVLESFIWSPKVVCADGVIVMYMPGTRDLFAAYDVATSQLLNNVFTSELPERVWRYEYDAMMYLGNGITCLASYSYDISPPQSHLYFIKFRFERSTQNPADLLITQLPEDSYTIGSSSLTFMFYAI